MDNKTKKIVFVIVASIISLISTVVGIVFGVPQDAIKDAVDIDTALSKRCNLHRAFSPFYRANMSVAPKMPRRRKIKIATKMLFLKPILQHSLSK